jgi:hypothetical protein
VTRLASWLFAHRADVLAAVVYTCLAFLSFSALSEYANTADLFPQPTGGWAFAVAIDGAVLYAFISFRRAPLLASLLLVSGAATSFVLQQWHASADPHPAVVAGVVPAAMVLVTFAWHSIRSRMPDLVAVSAPAPGPAPTSDPDVRHDRDARVGITPSGGSGDGRSGGGGRRTATPARPTKTELSMKPAAVRMRAKRARDKAALTPSQNGDGPHA